MRRLIMIVGTLAVLASLLPPAWYVWKSLPRVPEGGGMSLAEYRVELKKRGLRLGRVTLTRPHDPPYTLDLVHPDTEGFRGRVLPGTKIDVQVDRPDDLVTVPQLLGMYGEDAAKVLNYARLRPQVLEGTLRRTQEGEMRPWPKRGYPVSVVLAQEPEAGTKVPWGSIVKVRAPYVHESGKPTPQGFQPIHGLFYLRYGLRDQSCLYPCHSLEGCAKSGCHRTKAFELLRPPRED